MFRITPGAAPTMLLQAVLTPPETRDVPPLNYKGMPSAIKDEIRQSLFAAQKGRCAYCEERIVNDSALTKIEHFHPQNPKEDATSACLERTGLAKANISRADVTWGNLLLCCRGHQGSGSAGECCDTKKSDTDICETSYSPRDIAGDRSSLISISSDGVATVVYYPGDQISSQRVIDNVLNLNLRRLKDNRARLFRLYAERYQHFANANKTARAAERRKKFSDKIYEDILGGAPYPSTLASVADFIERNGSK